MTKYKGNLKLLPNKTWQMGISLGFQNGKRIRKYRISYSDTKEKAIEDIKKFYNEYKDIMARNKSINNKTKIIRQSLREYCSNNKCDLNCNKCKVKNFFDYVIMKYYDEYEVNNG